MVTSELPGDELILSPRKIITHTITIKAPSEIVWPWLVQLGASRAGWYSYDRIDNGGTPSAKKSFRNYSVLQLATLCPLSQVQRMLSLYSRFFPAKLSCSLYQYRRQLRNQMLCEGWLDLSV